MEAASTSEASVNFYQTTRLNNTEDILLLVTYCVLLFSLILLFIVLPLYSIMQSKRKRKCDNEAQKTCKIVTLHEKIRILDKVRSRNWPNITYIFYFELLNFNKYHYSILMIFCLLTLNFHDSVSISLLIP
jgi:hypothetical protein